MDVDNVEKTISIMKGILETEDKKVAAKVIPKSVMSPQLRNYLQILISAAEDYIENKKNWPTEEDNPYHEDIFPEISSEEWKTIDKLLQKNLGFPLDRVSGNIGRTVWRGVLRQLKRRLS